MSTFTVQIDFPANDDMEAREALQAVRNALTNYASSKDLDFDEICVTSDSLRETA